MKVAATSKMTRFFLPIVFHFKKAIRVALTMEGALVLEGYDCSVLFGEDTFLFVRLKE
jgi:hypothetical protein